jgi:hypothetical protein
MNGWLVIPDPNDPVNRVWAEHQPETVRGSAHVCTKCGEAWPCTAWADAQDEDFRRATADEPLPAIVIDLEL